MLTIWVLACRPAPQTLDATLRTVRDVCLPSTVTPSHQTWRLGIVTQETKRTQVNDPQVSAGSLAR